MKEQNVNRKIEKQFGVIGKKRTICKENKGLDIVKDLSKIQLQKGKTDIHKKKKELSLVIDIEE